MNLLIKKKKSTMWKLQVKFYLGQNEDCSPGDTLQIALRNCSKEAGGGSAYMWFWWRGNTCKHTNFPRRFLLFSWSFASHEKQASLWKILVLFLGMGRYKNWAHKIGLWKYWTIWRPVPPVFLSEHRVSRFCSTHSELLSGVIEGQQLQQHII